MKRGEWVSFSEADPLMHVHRMINGTVYLSRGEEHVEGKVMSVREVAMSAFVTLDNRREYELWGPFMWTIEEFVSGDPEVGDTIELRRKMTTVRGPITRVDKVAGGIQFHIPDYPHPLFVGNRHDSWRIEGVSK